MRLTVCFLLAVAALAQNTSNHGLDPTWDIAVILEQIGTDTARLLPVLDEVAAPAWMANGAPDTYVSQLQSSKEQVGAIAAEAKALARNPEKLSAGIQLFFRFEVLQTMLMSLEDAVRRYQDPRLAQKLAATFGDSGKNRERFRIYIVTLATEREHQFEVMDQETQRCRALLLSTPPPKNTVRKK